MVRAIIQCEHMLEALSVILDSAPPALGPSGQDPVLLARYEARHLALKLLRLLCQASVGSARALQSTGAVTTGTSKCCVAAGYLLRRALDGRERVMLRLGIRTCVCVLSIEPRILIIAIYVF